MSPATPWPHSHGTRNLQIRVLGPLFVGLGRNSMTPTAQKPRQVLSLLLLNANHIVQVSSLIEELWEESPPRSAVTTLQTYVMQIRKSIAKKLDLGSACVAEQILVTASGGYMFQVEPGTLDLHLYVDLVARGRQALDVCGYAQAAALLDTALALWRGAPVADVAAGPLLQREIVRLQESHLNTIEKKIEANLRLGNHGDIIGDLRALCMTHKLHEGLHEKFMIALHACGRRRDALEAFHVLRHALVEELGLEPSARLQQLHTAMLAGDPILL
jgi:DNA-binding SARP family transcriptional activator